MRRLRSAWITVLQTLLRLFPFPGRTGLVRIGNPGRRAPVLLTCNFQLTVERLRRSLEGIDAYLLIANSRGVNVWCAAAGGLMTHHDVVSVLKTSGIQELVDHRRVILPQLAAAGIEARLIHQRTGWEVTWGPVYADSLPSFLEDGGKKTAAMRTVRFDWRQRLEMAVAWAFPISVVALAVLLFWPQGVLPLLALVWAMSLVIFLSFPLYDGLLRPGRRRSSWAAPVLGERAIPLLLWVVFVLAVAASAAARQELSWPLILRWGLAALIVALALGLDLAGSTPLFKSGLHKDRLFQIALDEELCEGAGDCVEVCPTAVFRMDEERGVVALPAAERCVQCGACIVQCPVDALYFRTPEGKIVAPETIRKFKLNLLGQRARATSG